MNATDLLVSRTDLKQCELRTLPVPTAGPGEVLLKVDVFALTANNITYGVAGDSSIGYWQFFPAPEGFGRIPVWGFADVLASNAAGIDVGERFYGYLPMSTHVLLKPERVGKHGFVDGAAHRAALAPTYNQYTRCATDASWTKVDEPWQMLLRPLYMTSFFLDDFLVDNDFFGAQDVLLTSASSKTAFGLAYLLHGHLHRHQQRSDRCRVIGLTSGANRAFVERLGCYDSVLTYDDLSSLPQRSAVLIDMAGNAAVRRDVHTHYENIAPDTLKYSCGVGITHWQQPASERAALPGPRPAMFFAPAQIQKRAKEWGPGWMETRVAPAWRDFIKAAGGWIDVQQHRGPAAVQDAYAQMVAGRTPPNAGLLLSLWSD